MLIRRLLYGTLAMLIVGAVVTASAAGVSNHRRTTYLTFNGAVQLPGVSLPAGTYTFELPDPDHAWSIVRVSDRSTKRVYLTAFTTIVQRPRSMSPNQNVVFGEAPAGAPTPIKAWFPQDESTGRQFVY